MSIDIFQLTGIILKRWYYAVAGMLLGIMLGVAALLYHTPLYFATAALIIDPAKLDAPVAVPVGTMAGSEPARGLADSQAYLMGSRELLGEVVDKLSLADDEYLIGSDSAMAVSLSASPAERRNAAIAGLLSVMTIERESMSLVFTLTVKHPVSKTAADIANAVAAAYLEHTSDYRSQTVVRSASTLLKQAEELGDRLNAAKQAVEAFKAENGLLTTSTRGTLQDQSLEALNTQLATARDDVATKQASYEEARKVSVEDVEAGALAASVQSAALVSLRTRYAQFLDTQAQLSANLGANHPRLKAAASQAASMRKSIESELSRIRESLKNDYLVAKSKLAALEKEFDAATRATGDQAGLKTKLAQLESEAAALETLYQSTLSSAEGLSQQETSDAGTARIISEAVPPSQPKKLPKAIVLAAAAMFGFAAGCGIAVLQAFIESTGLGKGSSGRTTAPRAPVANEDFAPAADLPIIARLKAHVSPDDAENNLVRFPLQRSPKKTAQAQHLRDMALMRVAYILQTAAAEAGAVGQTYRVLFMSAAGGAVTGFDLRGIASALATRAQVWVADEQALVASRPSIVRSGSVKISLQNAHADEAQEWQGIGLPFERVVVRHMEHAGRNGEAFALVDACGTDAEDMLPVLLESSDAVVVVADRANATSSVLNEMAVHLEPWGEKVLGCVAIEPA